PAKELAALETDFETSPLVWTEAYPAYRPKYAAFAAKYPGTEAALTAKLRLIQFLGGAEDKDAMKAAAGKAADEILGQFPTSPQLATLVDRWYMFTNEKLGELFQKLERPEMPD